MFEAKIVILGDTTVGKTTFRNTLVDGVRGDSFISPISTPGPDHMTLKREVKGVDLKLKIWDTAGQEKYREMNQRYYLRSFGAFLVADLSVVYQKEDSEGRIRSLDEELTYWMNHYRQHADANAQMILIGNKSDLEEEPATVKTMEEFAAKHKMLFIKVSALRGTNVEKAMDKLLKMIYKQFFKYSNPVLDSPTSIIRRKLIEPSMIAPRTTSSPRSSLFKQMSNFFCCSSMAATSYFKTPKSA